MVTNEPVSGIYKNTLYRSVIEEDAIILSADILLKGFYPKVRNCSLMACSIWHNTTPNIVVHTTMSSLPLSETKFQEGLLIIEKEANIV